MPVRPFLVDEGFEVLQGGLKLLDGFFRAILASLQVGKRPAGAGDLEEGIRRSLVAE